METKANHVLIGAFTLTVVALVFGFIYWLARFDESAGRQPIYIVFEEAVTGLGEGGSVLFNGIKVGEVASLEVVPDDPHLVRAMIYVLKSTPVKRDTVARLEYQGLTGIAVIQLLGGSPAARPIGLGIDGEIPVIRADKSQLQDLIDSVRNIAAKGSKLFDRLDRTLAENEGPIERSFANVEKFTETLAANTDRIDSLLRDASSFASRLEGMSGGLDELIKGINALVGEGGGELMKNIGSAFTRIDTFLAENQDSLSDTIKNVENFSIVLSNNSERFDEFMANAGTLAERLNAMSVKLEGLFDRADKILGEEGEGLVKEARSAFARVDDFFEQNSTSFGQTLRNVEKFTDVFAENSEQIGKLINDASQFAEKLNKASDDIDRLIARVEELVDGDGASFLREARQAAETFRKMADELSERLDTATKGISRITGRGARELEAFLSEGRGAFQSIQRLIGQVERNPQRFFFGGSQVPEYNAR